MNTSDASVVEHSFTTMAKAVLQDAAQEAELMGYLVRDPLHILLGLSRVLPVEHRLAKQLALAKITAKKLRITLEFHAVIEDMSAPEVVDDMRQRYTYLLRLCKKFADHRGGTSKITAYDLAVAAIAMPGMISTSFFTPPDICARHEALIIVEAPQEAIDHCRREQFRK